MSQNGHKIVAKPVINFSKVNHVANLEEERGDDADDGVVEHDGDDEELHEGGEGHAVQGLREVPLQRVNG